MTIEKGKIFEYGLYIAGFLLLAVSLPALCFAGTVVMFFDSPSPNWSANYFFIFSVISFPIICILSGVGVLLLINKSKTIAFLVSLLPIFPIILIFVGSSWMNLASCGKLDCSTQTMQDQGNATLAAKCVPPVLGAADGLETTGCGVLETGVVATGVTTSTSEANNWQFSAHSNNRIKITLENQGNTCPQFNVLDSNGKVIKTFGDQCGSEMPATMVTTSYYYFDPPTNGSYVLRLFTPKTPGGYWVKIE